MEIDERAKAREGLRTGATALAFAFGTSAAIHALARETGSLLSAWRIAMFALPAGVALLSLVTARRIDAGYSGDGVRSAKTLLRCRVGLFVCWFAVGSSSASLIAIVGGFSTLRWMAPAVLLLSVLAPSGTQSRGA